MRSRAYGSGARTRRRPWRGHPVVEAACHGLRQHLRSMTVLACFRCRAAVVLMIQALEHLATAIGPCLSAAAALSPAGTATLTRTTRLPPTPLQRPWAAAACSSLTAAGIAAIEATSMILRSWPSAAGTAATMTTRPPSCGPPATRHCRGAGGTEAPGRSPRLQWSCTRTPPHPAPQGWLAIPPGSTAAWRGACPLRRQLGSTQWEMAAVRRSQ